MKFVNLNGKPLDVSTAGKPLKRASTGRSTQYHKGWQVTGYSPEQLAAAQAQHEREAAASRALGQREAPPWSIEIFMRTAKPKKVRSQPYETHDAAQQCAALATKAGWLGVTVVTLARA